MTHDIVSDKPQQLLGLARLMQMAFHGHDLNPLYCELATRIRADERDAAAMLDMSLILQLNQQSNLARELQWQALQQQQHYRLHRKASGSPLRVLALMTPGSVMDNTPIEFLVEHNEIHLELLYVGQGLPTPTYIPEHDVAFVAVCESSENQLLLAHLAEVMQAWPKPFVNEPSRIAQLSRDRIGQWLQNSSAVVSCQAKRFSRARLENAGDLEFPLVIRPVDSHAGHGLCKLESPEETRNYLSEYADRDVDFFVTPFVDYSSRDGLFRKYRVAIVDGRPFPAHMAVSPRWMVHYLNADMLNNADNRRSEANFMNSFERNFAVKHARAFREIDTRLGLDYYSLDCAETLDGRLLVFEIDSGAVVHAMDPVSKFPYKLPHMRRLFAAFRNMLIRIAAASDSAVRRAA